MFRCHLVILADTYRCSIDNAFLWPWGVSFVYTIKGKHYMGHALNSLVFAFQTAVCTSQPEQHANCWTWVYQVVSAADLARCWSEYDSVDHSTGSRMECMSFKSCDAFTSYEAHYTSHSCPGTDISTRRSLISCPHSTLSQGKVTGGYWPISLLCQVSSLDFGQPNRKVPSAFM